ncbi:MAG: hypothetical protein PHH40_04380 [Candidatus Moranbacteria bacterium]|nr:hypothetical protein [Candidatus Moranbacteria bacterium]MDD3964527.1 hypothetical protein [Candidatus Moranbacteria bacterium]
MYRRIFFLSIFFFSFFLTFAPISASAALIPCGRNSGTAAEMAPCTICHIIVGGSGIITWGLSIMTVIAIVVIVAMAILYIVSAGDEGMMSTAKGGIKAAFIGFAVMLSAWLIVMTVLRVTSANVPGLGISARGFTFSCDTSR